MSRFSWSVLVPLVAFACEFGSLRAQNNPPLALPGVPQVPAGTPGPHTPIPPPTLFPQPVVPGQPSAPSPDPGPRLDFVFDDLPLEEVIKRVQVSYQKESGKYLNVMVPEQLRNVVQTNMITLEVRQVTVADLFNLLSRASQRNLAIFTGGNSSQRGSTFYQRTTAGYRFEPISVSSGTQTYLLLGDYPPELISPPPEPPGPEVTPPSRPQMYVQFYQLEPYLDRFTVEDITTAIKTGADLAGYKGAPTMKFHEETKLLVAYGAEPEIIIIQQVLDRLNARRREEPGTVRPPPQKSVPIPAQSQPVLPPPPAKP